MKRLDINNYYKSMGMLIDIQNQVDYQKYHHPDSINIPYEKLLLNYKTLLDKNKSYYIVCNKGTKSRKAVSILEFYGYDVTQMSYE
ncbi:MAG: rhodanese-like domain-containing protein [Firmicutes bacterium]|nr:rhodanese-like domain-containing protein [Bacillota bacterium]